MKISQLLESKPAWEHEDPLVRHKAIDERDIEDSVLARLAASDPDPQVRIAATRKLNNTDTLVRLAEHASLEQQQAAIERWLTLVDATTALTDIDNEALLLAVASAGPDEQTRLAATARLSTREALLSLLETDNYTRVHQQIADRLTEEQDLELVRKRFQEKDKRVHQIAKDKLAVFRDARARSEDLRQQSEHVCEALESLSIQSEDSAMARRLDALEQRWRDLVQDDNEIADEIRNRAEAAINQCRERINQIRAEQSARESAIASVLQQIDQLGEALKADAGVLAELPARLAALNTQWPDSPDDETQVTTYSRFVKQAEQAIAANERLMAIDLEQSDQQQLQRCLTDLDWPLDVAVPDTLRLAREKLGTLQDDSEAIARTRERRLEITSNQLEEFERKIESGNLKSANKASKTLTKSLKEHASLLPASVQEDFSRLTQRLKELRDWHNFVTNPKRTALCEQMEALVDNETIAPTERLETIKSLQETWKSLGPSDNPEAQQLWSRFKQASDLAYAPCAAYFEAQKQERAENLKARETICAELETFNSEHDWTDPDYKALASLVSRGLARWRKAGEVPRARFRKIADRFNKAMTPLQERLNAEYERNKQRKNELIEQVRQLATDETAALTTIIEQAKRLQREWQSIGKASHRTEQKLWKAFRAECDRIFERRDQERDTAREQTRAAKGGCEDVIRRFRALIDSDEVERGDLRRFRDEFDKTAKEAGKAAPRKAFTAAVKQAEKCLERRARAARESALDEIRRLSSLCRKLEIGELDAAQVAAAWASEIDIDGEILQRLETRRDLAPAAADQDANIESARLLCIRAEILAGLDSPAEAQPLRMQYQVDRLNRELSQGKKDSRTPAEQFRDIQLEWYCLGPLPVDIDDLVRRFNNAEQALGRIG